ncbi:WhiB family transcriptional regulator [Kocuria coralli]|uniref:Transcriptional regulator WhiB n=1 Tax=Kocuria coralli TaxID=1461025 RepID=A0A5J5KYJ9_9MICC|nr:WhiB family transcriptional regulator [Kocuria coralli]KAA9394602.1 WhiB family transcriptional regulator [Kocuria coralli]
MGEPAYDNAEVAQTARRRRGSRSVPQDWFLDPVDPDAAQRLNGTGGPATATDTVDYAPDAAAVPGSIWQAVAGAYGIEADEGELAWQTDALCAQTDPEAFFPEKGGSTRDAKRVCEACPVRSECLDYAMAHDEKFGIWGGLSERERRRLRRAGR